MSSTHQNRGNTNLVPRVSWLSDGRKALSSRQKTKRAWERGWGNTRANRSQETNRHEEHNEKKSPLFAVITASSLLTGKRPF